MRLRAWAVSVALLASCSPDGGGSPAELDGLPGANVEDSRDGVPTFISGDLGHAQTGGGKLDAADAASALPAFLAKVAPVFHLKATDLKLLGVTTDADGAVHARYRQLQYGFDVAGAELLVHVDKQGVVYAVNGSARGGGDPSMAALVSAGEAVDRILGSSAYRGMSAGAPRLAFVQDDARDLRLAWEIRVEGDRDGEPIDDRVFVDARSGATAAVFPQIHSERKRKIYTAYNAQLPSTEERLSEGQMSTPSTDPLVSLLYDHIGVAYDCYKALFKRDSFDDKGGAITGVVHYGANLNNAYHQGNGVIVFGDGDGRTFGPFGRSLDVVAHELTHGVTGATANLQYSNESGALNESMSDVFGAICESWSRGANIDVRTWQVGEDCYTPAKDGDAMRDMSNPTVDEESSDFYPERYLGGWDNGGVHLNSGVGNLAFKLLVTGGKHPRGKTSVEVPALGMTKAAQIFYRGLTTYLSSTSQFSDARAATLFAAKELYGEPARAAVAAAWSAVGVEAPDAAPALPPFTLLTGGAAQAGLKDDADGQKVFAIDVPAGAGQLVVETHGGTGDVDLFVSRGAAPAPYRNDQGSANLGSNDERIAVASPAAGRYYVLVSAISKYEGVTLTARAGEAPGAAEALTPGRWQTVGGDKGTARTFSLDVPAGAGWLAVELDGKGDADLYLRRGAAPTVTAHDVAAATAGTAVERILVEPTAGKYFVLVQGGEGWKSARLRATLMTPTPIADGAALELTGSGGLAALYKLDVPADAKALEVTLHGKAGASTGDADVYVRAGKPPTDESFDVTSRVEQTDEIVRVSHPTAGPTYIAVYGSGAFTGAELRVGTSKQDLPAAPLVNNMAATIKVGAGETWRFSYQMAPTAIDATFRFGGGDGSMTVKLGDKTWTDTKQQVTLAPVDAGAYELAVTPKAALSGWVRAGVHLYPSLRDGRSAFLSGPPESRKVLKFDAPADAKTVTITLQGGTGDADIYLKKGAVPTKTDFDDSAEESGNAGSVTAALSGAATYYLLVVGYDDYALAEVKTVVTK